MKPFSSGQVKKFAVLMTDGEYNVQYSASGVKGISPNGTSTQQALALCEGMKKAGITVITVGFDLDHSVTALETMKTCASSPSLFFTAADGNALLAVFRTISRRMIGVGLTK